LEHGEEHNLIIFVESGSMTLYHRKNPMAIATCLTTKRTARLFAKLAKTIPSQGWDHGTTIK